MNLPLYGPRFFLESPDESFDIDYGLGGPGQGVEADDLLDATHIHPVTITHGPSFLPLMALGAYQTIACVQAGAASGIRVELWSRNGGLPSDPGAAPGGCLLIEVINLGDAAIVGSVADQLRALLGPEQSKNIRNPRRALQ